MRCNHCPRDGLPCRGETASRLCQLVDPAHKDYDRRYFKALDDDNYTRVDADAASPLVDQDLSESIGLIRRMKACQFWSRGKGCCDGFRCALKKGQPVWYDECFECLKKYGD